MRYFNLIVLALSLQSLPAFSADTVRVLIIDTGVDKTNPTLSQVFCPKEESLDATTHVVGIPTDASGHGTHVAGIIRALAGPKGYCLAFCKYYLETNPGKVNSANTVLCINHAKSIGATYVNYSSGGTEFIEDERLAIAALDSKIMVAAGNDNKDIYGVPKYYPAAYGLPNEVAVGSFDSQCEKAPTSNYGLGVIFMLGQDVYSSLPNNQRGSMSGSSMATAVATGVALRALLGLHSIGDCKDYANFLRAFWSSR